MGEQGRNKDPGRAGSNHVADGRAAASRSDWEQAVASYRRALELDDDGPTRISLAEALIQVALLSQRAAEEAEDRKNGPEAIRLYQRASEQLVEAEKLGRSEPIELGFCYYRLGCIATERKDFESALTWLNKAASVYEIVEREMPI